MKVNGVFPESPSALSALVVEIASVGGTSFTVIRRGIADDVSSPPRSVPPLSFRRTVKFAMPSRFAAGVNVSRPVAEISGPALKRTGLSLLISNVSV